MSAGEAGKFPSAELAVLGYCVYCRARRQMSGAIQVCNRRGGRDLKGLCSVCGKSMYRLGGWDSVAAAREAARNPASRSEAEAQPSDQDTTAPALPAGSSSAIGEAATIAPPGLSESASPAKH